jgi:hypothetical protein
MRAGKKEIVYRNFTERMAMGRAFSKEWIDRL